MDNSFMDNSLEIVKENNQIVLYPETVKELGDRVLFRSVLTIDSPYDLRSAKHRAKMLAYDNRIRKLEAIQNECLEKQDKEGLFQKYNVQYDGIDHIYQHNVSMELFNLYALRSFYLVLGDYEFSEILNAKSMSCGIQLILDLKNLVVDEQCTTKVISRHINYLGLNLPEIILYIEKNLRHTDIEYTACLFKSNRLLGNNFVSNISRMGMVIGTHVGASTDIIELVRVIRENPRIHELVNSKIITDNKDMPVVENENRENIKEGIELLSNTDSNLGRLIQAGTGVKTNEVYQEVFALGNRPSMTGLLYPYFINESFLDGLSPLAYFIQSNSSRKFQQINAAMISKTGYTQRIFNLAFSSHNKTYDGFCGSVNQLRVVIPSLKELMERYLGRNCFILDPLGNKQEFYIPEDADHILRRPDFYMKFVNRELFLYSPLTCAHADGYCEKCLGWIYNIKHINHASYCGTVFSAQLGNRLLGTKHLIVTNGASFPNLAGFPDQYGVPSKEHEILQELFINHGQYMIPRPDRVLSLNILVGNIRYNSFMPYINELQLEYITDDGEVKNKILHFYGNNKLYLTTPMENYIDYKRSSNVVHHIDLQECIEFNNKINNESSFNTFPLFYTLSRTPETIDTVKKVQDIIMSSTDNVSIEDMYYNLLNALEDAKINFNSTHVEMVLSIIISSSLIKGERPNFKRPLTVKDYRWINIRESIKTSATANQMGFEHHMNSLKTPTSFDKGLLSSNDTLFIGTDGEHLRKVQDANNELLLEMYEKMDLSPEQIALLKPIFTV